MDATCNARNIHVIWMESETPADLMEAAEQLFGPKLPVAVQMAADVTLSPSNSMTPVTRRVYNEVKDVEPMVQFKTLNCALKLEFPTARCERDLRQKVINEACTP